MSRKDPVLVKQKDTLRNGSTTKILAYLVKAKANSAIKERDSRQTKANINARKI